MNITDPKLEMFFDRVQDEIKILLNQKFDDMIESNKWNDKIISDRDEVRRIAKEYYFKVSDTNVSDCAVEILDKFLGKTLNNDKNQQLNVIAVENKFESRYYMDFNSYCMNENISKDSNKTGDFEDYDNTSGDNFWGNVGAGVLPICIKTKRILMQFRSVEVNEPFTFGVIGGKLDEENETQSNIEEVVEREFQEETSCKSNFKKLIPSFIYNSPNNTFTYYNFIGLLEEEFEPIPDWETDYFQWMSYDEFMECQNKWHFGLVNLYKNDSKTIQKQ